MKLRLARISQTNPTAEAETSACTTLRLVGLLDVLHEYACVGRSSQALSSRRFRLFVTSWFEKSGLALLTIVSLLALPSSAYGRQHENLYGVWRMTYYSREGKEVDWTGLMILTPKHFSRSYMAKERPLVRDGYDTPDDLTDEEKNNMVEAFHQKYGGASGTYRVENNTLILDPVYPANTRLLGRSPQRQFELDGEGKRLTLKGTMTRGYVVEEVWEKVEDLN